MDSHADMATEAGLNLSTSARAQAFLSREGAEREIERMRRRATELE